MESLQSLASTVIGKVLIWIIGILVATSMSLAVWVYILKADVKVEKANKAAAEATLNSVTGQLTQNYIDYLERLSDANKTNTVVQTRFVERVKNIIQRVEVNATCDDAMSDINIYQY